MATSNREPDYAERRRRLIEDLGGDGVLVLPASPEIVVGRGLELPYRPDADLLYLTGYDEPEAVLLLGALDNEERCVLFVRPRDPEIERRSEEHTSELQSRGHLVCRLLLEKKHEKEGALSRPKDARATEES